MIETHGERFDVAVIGAGPAGSATARRLALRGCRVALIEQSRFDAPRVGESLAPAVQPLLEELGVWADFVGLNQLASHGTRSWWGEMTPQVHSHLMSPWGCGWHVDRVAFDRMLAQAAQSAGAVLLCGMAFRHRDDAENDSALTLIERSDDGSPRELHLRARVIVDATGRRARLARSFGAQRLLFDRLIAVATLFDGMDVAREGYVVVETAREGWWYSAPVPAGRMMAMLMTDSDVCGRADLFSAPVWHDRLQAAQATRARTAAGTPLWGPRVFSAISQRLRRSEYRGHWLAVGDAALATDPVAGNGVVRALRSARAGAETALALLEGKAESALRQYEDDRDRECDSYLHERAAYYGIERRWQQSVFWQRRLRAAA